jgi:hypothetical protein
VSNKTAMLLTQEEWEDAAAFAQIYLASTAWYEYEGRDPGFIRLIDRRRKLAQRIVDAVHE